MSRQSSRGEDRKRGSLGRGESKRLSAASSQGKLGRLGSKSSTTSQEKGRPRSRGSVISQVSQGEVNPFEPSLEEEESAGLDETTTEVPDGPEMSAGGEDSPAAEGEGNEGEGPPRPPLPEDIGYQAGFQAVAENRVADAVALAMSPFWPFTNELTPHGWTLLHMAAHKGHEELCAAMCQRKDFLGVDLPDKEFCATALHIAAGKRRASCCSAIVESGRCKQVNSKDINGQTALHLAALRADRESYAAIAAHPDCNPLLPDKHGRSAVEYAADRGLEVDCQVPGHSEIEM
ncbi:unnamed protein product [Effrenium voratum]|uniref:Uncharacterized protein n=1 Tax=Effrenium voratum TaxID=2562239 RepID=A0AA36MTU1_9DINO|nr:unnamed protein product [Effrenium voratum]